MYRAWFIEIKLLSYEFLFVLQLTHRVFILLSFRDAPDTNTKLIVRSWFLIILIAVASVFIFLLLNAWYHFSDVVNFTWRVQKRILLNDRF